MLPPGFQERALGIADYDAVCALWAKCPGVVLNESDTREAIASYLARNDGLSRLVLSPDGNVAGAVLCGHDGRRGFLHHLAVAPEHRRGGIARALVSGCLRRLAGVGIAKTNIYLLAGNEAGRAFWLREGWYLRDDLVVMQHGNCGC